MADKPSGLLSVPGKPPDMDDCVETRAKAAFDSWIELLGRVGQEGDERVHRRGLGRKVVGLKELLELCRIGLALVSA